MLNTGFKSQNNQQCLFGCIITTDLHSKIKPIQAKPFKTSTTTMSNVAFVANKFPEAQMDTSKSFIPQRTNYCTMGMTSSTNKFQQIGMGMSEHNPSIRMQKPKSTQNLPGNFGFKPDFINNGGFDNRAKVVSQKLQMTQNQKRRINPDIQMKFEVNGSAGIPVVDNFQDQQFESGCNNRLAKSRQGKFSRTKTVMMAAMAETEDESFKTVNIDDDMAKMAQQIIDKFASSVTESDVDELKQVIEDVQDIKQFRNAQEKFYLISLPYALNDLEPVFTMDEMMIFHRKYHVAYVNQLNKSLQEIGQILESDQPVEISNFARIVKYKVGGHQNYINFLQSLAPTSEGGGVIPEPDSTLGKAIEKQYGSFNVMAQQFLSGIECIEGQAFACLAYNTNTELLEIQTISHQEIISKKYEGLVPLLMIDAWVNVYNMTLLPTFDFKKNIWQIINWNKANERLEEVLVGDKDKSEKTRDDQQQVPLN